MSSRRLCEGPEFHELTVTDVPFGGTSRSPIPATTLLGRALVLTLADDARRQE